MMEEHEREENYSLRMCACMLYPFTVLLRCWTSLLTLSCAGVVFALKSVRVVETAAAHILLSFSTPIIHVLKKSTHPPSYNIDIM